MCVLSFFFSIICFKFFKDPIGLSWAILGIYVFSMICVSKTCYFNLFFFFFFCLFKWSLRAGTHLGPDGTRLEQNAQARLKKPIWAYWPIGLWKCKERETDLIIWGYEMKEKKTMATSIKSSWTILISALRTRERRFFIQSQLPLRLNLYAVWNVLVNWFFKAFWSKFSK